MKTILIFNTKGGCGKTTTAMYLATAFARSSPNLKGIVVDGDPIRTAIDWATEGQEDGISLPFDVKCANPSNLKRKISRYDWAVIDAPAGDGSARFFEAAIALADVVIIPTRPTRSDMRRMWVTESEARQHSEAIVLITQAATHEPDDRREAFSVLDSEGVSYFETFIPFRADIGRADGTLPGPQMHNYDIVFTELKEAMQWDDLGNGLSSSPGVAETAETGSSGVNIRFGDTAYRVKDLSISGHIELEIASK